MQSKQNGRQYHLLLSFSLHEGTMMMLPVAINKTGKKGHN